MTVRFGQIEGPDVNGVEWSHDSRAYTAMPPPTNDNEARDS
jgi:hypothetical protein